MPAYSFFVKGMDCAEEIAILKEALLPAVDNIKTNLSFDLVNGKVTVQIPDLSDAAERNIRKLISGTGMEAITWEAFCKDGVCGIEESFWHRRGRSLMCTASGLLAASGFFWHALSSGFIAALTESGDHWSSFPTPAAAAYLGAVMTAGWYILPRAWNSARHLRPDMNLLMTVAVSGAVVIGVLFEAATVSFLFAFSLLLESWSVGRARKAISSLIDKAPAVARLINPNNGSIEEKHVEEVPVGATVIIRPGEKIPLDGIVEKGESYVDQAAITGESKPAYKTINDEVFAGTINGDRTIEIKTTKPSDDTTFARIIRMVEDAQSRRAPTEQWVEKFARIYTPSMLGLAFVIATVPPLFFGGVWSIWFYQALVILVIGCPCALVISTPVSIVAGLTAAAGSGVLIKGGAFLEAAARLKAIAFDKTGTLTHGKPVVEEIVPVHGHSEEEIIRNAAALEAHSTHPLAGAVLEMAAERNIDFQPAENFTMFRGKGADGTIDGKSYWIGSHRYLHEKVDDHREFHEKADMLEAEGKSVVTLGTADHVCGLISLSDRIRDNTPEVIQSIKKNGLKKVVMLTGDNEGTARRVAEKTGIDEFKAELLPEDKVDMIRRMVAEYEFAAMVGDGVNDAPALAASSLGIAMGAAGSDAAIETADIALMSDDLSKIPWLIGHSRRTLNIIKQNILSALSVKLAFLILATAGIATLWMAIAADMGASLAVIFNSLRLLNGKQPLSFRQ